MEETSVVAQASPSSRDLSEEIKNCAHDCSCGSSHEFSLSMPICYLIKEQAKSVVAIQELQNRLNRVEKVQEDVIDAIGEFRNILCDSKSLNSTNRQTTHNSLNFSKSPSNPLTKVSEVSKFNTIHVPFTDVSSDVPHSTIKSRSYPVKDCDPTISEYGRHHQASACVNEPSQKHFDFMKSKDSALESDKQDSGLDSDCREHHEIHPSLKILPIQDNRDGSDELLQLLDEIGHRSVLLQRRIAVADEVAVDDPREVLSFQNGKDISDPSVHAEPKFADSVVSFPELADPQCRLTSTTIFEGRGLMGENKVPMLVKQNNFEMLRLLEGKSICDNNATVKNSTRVSNGIDSNVVSAILKENNVMELQRKALVYLVDNAMLQNRLSEFERVLSSSKSDNEKVENTLKEENRLLMMENRELRIYLDEQRIEAISLKSRISMLERVVQSISSENQELNWQLGETLNLRKQSNNIHNNHSRLENSLAKSAKKSTLEAQQSLRKDVTFQCTKSKLLSDNSSFLDITAEDSDDLQPDPSTAVGLTLKCPGGPVYSSTPMLPLQKQLELKSLLHNSSIPGDKSPANFQSVKKCLQSSYGCDNTVDTSAKVPSSRKLLGETFCKNSSDIRSKRFQSNTSIGGTMPLEGIDKFPFNTILEKLKANSEHRLTRSASAKNFESTRADNAETYLNTHVNKSVPLLESDSVRPSKDIKLTQSNVDSATQRRKGRNIQQRIQNILDRIVAESEEAS